MTANTINFNTGGCNVPTSTNSRADAMKLLGIPEAEGSHKGIIAVRAGEIFHALRGHIDRMTTRGDGFQGHFNSGEPNTDWSEDGHPEIEYSMTVHYPIDRRSIARDIEGATVAKRNEDGTAWLFHKSSKAQMRDDEMDALPAIHAAFQKQVDALDYASRTAAPSGVIQARLKYVSLVAFRDRVADHALATLRGRYVGWAEDNPGASHIHELVRSSIAATVKAHGDSYPTVAAEIAKSIPAQHEYEMPWEQRARLAKEAEAAAAQDQQQGE